MLAFINRVKNKEQPEGDDFLKSMRNHAKSAASSYIEILAHDIEKDLLYKLFNELISGINSLKAGDCMIIDNYIIITKLSNNNFNIEKKR